MVPGIYYRRSSKSVDLETMYSFMTAKNNSNKFTLIVLYMVAHNGASDYVQKIYGRFVSSFNKNDHQNTTLIIVMETLNI